MGFNLVFNVAFLLRGLLISVQPPLVDFADLSVKVVENTARSQLEVRYGHNTSNNLQPAREAVNKERGSLLYKPEWFESDLRVYPPAAKHIKIDLATHWIPPPRVSHNSVDSVLSCQFGRLFICLFIENNPGVNSQNNVCNFFMKSFFNFFLTSN